MKMINLREYKVEDLFHDLFTPHTVILILISNSFHR